MIAGMSGWQHFLGLAQKSRRLVSGEAASLVSLRKGTARLVITAKDCGEQLKKTLIRECRRGGVPMLTLGDKVELGQAIGRSPRSVVVVTDEGFKDVLLQRHFTDGGC